MALGWGDAETAVALGVEPVGAADWLAHGGDGLGPWMTKRYATPPRILGTIEVELEQVAALKPDLILDTRSSGEQGRQDQLAKLGVPVVALPDPADARYLTNWEDQLDMIGRALGRSAQAAQLRSALDAKFDRVAAANPAFKGASVVVGARTTTGWGAYVEGSSRIDFVERLGFVNSPAVQALAGNNFSVPVSEERLDLLDADLTVISPIGVEPEAITGEPAVPAGALGAGGPLGGARQVGRRRAGQRQRARPRLRAGRHRALVQQGAAEPLIRRAGPSAAGATRPSRRGR